MTGIRPIRLAGVFCALAATTRAPAQNDFWNWETPHVSPIALTPNGNTLVTVNTADNRIELFNVSTGIPVWIRSVDVGLDPVSVRARNNNEAWVVNHLSDSISIVDLPTGRIVRTLQTGDEPTDVVFAGAPQRAFVSVSQLNQVRIFDPLAPQNPPVILNIAAEDPRAMTVSPDGTRVYVALFESGNNTTSLRQQDVSNPNGPYQGRNPPPNNGNNFSPPPRQGNPPGPPSGLIVRRDTSTGSTRWLDINGRDWATMVTWNLADHDVAIISELNAATPAVSYANGMLTTVMGIGVRSDGTVTVVGTDAANDIRFEPNVQSIFMRVLMGSFAQATPGTTQTADLNPQLTYAVRSVPQTTRDLAIGDPRAIAWHPTSGNAYIAGMGSNNLIVTTATGARLTQIEVGEGPTGLALDASGARLYVLNRFEGTVSFIDTASNTETARVPFHDPTPLAVKLGRPLLYDTHRTSGLGHIACASCHIDGRTDFLAWDLGDPSAAIVAFNQTCRQPTCGNWHPIKGPMVTQTLQGLANTEPFHWRGDRDSLAEFAPAFVGLQGDDNEPSAAEMLLFENFINTIKYPPNPIRNFDNSLPTAINSSLGGVGDPNRGVNIYNTLPTVGGSPCISCHGGMPGPGTNRTIDFPNLPLAPQNLKMAQLRNMHEKTGFLRNSQSSNRGFGFNHHSEHDTIGNLLFAGFNFAPGPTGLQQRRDVEALMLCFSTDTHAGVGQQITYNGANNNDNGLLTRFNTFLNLANANAVGLICKGRQGGIDRGYMYLGGSTFQTDRQVESINATTLRTAANAGSELTFTLVPFNTRQRTGIDRDADGYFDRDELDAGSSPMDGNFTPLYCPPNGDMNRDNAVDGGDIGNFVNAVHAGSMAAADLCRGDFSHNGIIDMADVPAFIGAVMGG